jgi:hypothetical protein
MSVSEINMLAETLQRASMAITNANAQLVQVARSLHGQNEIVVAARESLRSFVTSKTTAGGVALIYTDA